MAGSSLQRLLMFLGQIQDPAAKPAKTSLQGRQVGEFQAIHLLSSLQVYLEQPKAELNLPFTLHAGRVGPERGLLEGRPFCRGKEASAGGLRQLAGQAALQRPRPTLGLRHLHSDPGSDPGSLCTVTAVHLAQGVLWGHGERVATCPLCLGEGALRPAV